MGASGYIPTYLIFDDVNKATVEVNLMQANIYERDLGRNAANFQPLTPLTSGAS